MKKVVHLPGLDGLRGIGVLIVVFGHLRNILFYGHAHYLELMRTAAGQVWFIMDMFFALSGYLITGILLDTKNSGNYFRGFYIRRALRIFPIYYVILLFVTVLAALDRFHGYGDLPYYFVYLQNYVPEPNMWADKRFSLSHTWSLAVEEQFYLLWPIVVWKVKERKTLVWICSLLVPLVLIARVITMLRGASIETLAFWTPFRFDGMMLGALAALAIRMLPEEKFGAMLQWARIAFVAAIALNIGFYCFSPNSRVLFACSPTFYGIACTSIILLVQRRRSLTHKILSPEIFQWFGKYSYGIYLFHFLFIFRLEDAAVWLRFRMNAHLAGLLLCSAYVALVSLAGWCSYNFFEIRFIQKKELWAPREEPLAVAKREKLLMSS